MPIKNMQMVIFVSAEVAEDISRGLRRDSASIACLFPTLNDGLTPQLLL